MSPRGSSTRAPNPSSTCCADWTGTAGQAAGRPLTRAATIHTFGVIDLLKSLVQACFISPARLQDGRRRGPMTVSFRLGRVVGAILALAAAAGPAAAQQN